MPMLRPRLENWLEVRRAIEHKDRSVIEYFRRRALAAGHSGCIVENDNFRRGDPYNAAFFTVTAALADGCRPTAGGFSIIHVKSAGAVGDGVQRFRPAESGGAAAVADRA